MLFTFHSPQTVLFYQISGGLSNTCIGLRPFVWPTLLDNAKSDFAKTWLGQVVKTNELMHADI